MSSKMFRKSILVNCILLSCFGLSSVYAENNENNVYKAPTQGKTTLLMMLDTSAGMDDNGSGARPRAPDGSIYVDYPNCRNQSLSSIRVSTLDNTYGLQLLTDGSTRKSTFAYDIPYCNNSGSYVYSRMDRMKIAMSMLLGSANVSSDIVMGLGQFSTQSDSSYQILTSGTPQNSSPSYYPSYYGLVTGQAHKEGNDVSAKIIVPSSGLDGDQRYKMRVAVTTLGSGGKSPLASALAESGAYMLGRTTLDSGGGSPTVASTQNSSVNPFWYGIETQYGLFGSSQVTCFMTTQPSSISRRNNNSCQASSFRYYNYSYSGFNDSAQATKELDPNSSNGQSRYKTPVQTNTQQCNANGIFLVTNSAPTETPKSVAQTLMQNVIPGFTCPNSGGVNGIQAVTASDGNDYGWTCMAAFAQELNRRKIKVAVAGYGNTFSPYIGQDRNGIYNCNNANVSQDVKNACYLGNLGSGYGEGGFYPVIGPETLSNAVQGFISTLNTSIPSAGATTPTVPYDTLNNTQQLSSVYYAQFQPDIRTGQNIGIWLGNIKKYLIDSNGFYKDKNSNTVLDINGNLISSQDYWNATGNDDANTQKGGALSQLPVPQRKIYRESESTNSKLQLPLVATDLQSRANDTTQTIDDRLTAKYLLNLMGYSIPVERSGTQRVATVTNDQLSRGPFLRQMGASLHSSPVFFTTEAKLCLTAQTNSACSDGQDAQGRDKPKKDYYDRKDFILFGTMQGLIQVVNADTGIEAFSFLPDAIVGSQQNGFVAKSLQTDSNVYKSLYQGMDAPWTVYANYASNGTTNQSIKASTLNVYGGMRRGGNNYYGLDLATNDGSSFTPKRLFTIAPSSDPCSTTNPTGCMGQSWSKPTIGWIKWKGKPQLVMIVGGGYDPQFDDKDYKVSSATKGNGVYIFAAKSNSDLNVNAGDLLWWASSSANDVTTGTNNTPYAKNNPNLKYSVVSEIKTVDRDSDGFIDNLYFGDLGGQIFRVDINNVDSNETNSIAVTNVVRLANFSKSGKVAPRFYNMPTFTVHNKSSLNRVGDTANFYGVLSIGSGDVSSPSQFAGNNIAITDKVYGIFDRDVGRSDLYKSTYSPPTADQLITLESLTSLASSFSSDSMKSSSGWYDELTGSSYSSSSRSIVSQDANQLTRYKVLNGSSALKNTLFMSYYDAADSGSSGACQAGIKGRTYLKTYCLPYVRKVGDGFVCDGTGGGTGRSYSSGVGLDLGSGIQPLVVNGYQSNGTNTIGPITPNGNTNVAKYSMSLKFVSNNWYEE